MKIEITSLITEKRTVRGKDGKEYTFYTQQAFFHNGGKYPEAFKLTLKEDSPLSVGFYTIAPASFYVDKYGALSIRRNLLLIDTK
jgi:hypothetical protein